MKKHFYFVFVLALASMLYSCGKMPQAEIDAAKTSLETARNAQADIYLENEFNALQDSLSATLVAIESQKSKIFGDFKDAKANLEQISAQATELVSKTESKKEEIKTEIAQAQASIQALLEENQSLLSTAPKGKEGKMALEAIGSDLSTVNTSVSEIPAMVEKGDLLDAQTKMNAAQQKATDINTELKTVLEKYSKKG